jgi:D-tyrosyl-tRNA(Tyr) deacylase
MRVVLQRVKSGSVSIDGSVVAEISSGIVCLVGICSSDTVEDVRWMSTRLLGAKVQREL